jgi:hypothetical protein
LLEFHFTSRDEKKKTKLITHFGAESALTKVKINLWLPIITFQLDGRREMFSLKTPENKPFKIVKASFEECSGGKE